MAKKKSKSTRSAPAGRKTRRSAPKSRPPRQPGAVKRWWSGLAEPTRKRIGRACLRGAAAMVLVLAVVGGMLWLRSRVLDAQPHVRLDQIRIIQAEGFRPDWMPTDLARSILRGACPTDEKVAFDDPAYAETLYNRLRENPWVREVIRVSRHRSEANPAIGLVEVRARYRRPFAAVYYRGPRGGSAVGVVDRFGVRLPSAAGRADLVAIEGVAAAPPRRPGAVWPGADLADALKVLRLVEGRPYYEQFVKVDVSNHGGRISPEFSQIDLIAQVGRGPATVHHFGRFPVAGRGDWVISPEQKLVNLDRIAAANNGRLGGIESHDLRVDNVEARSY